MILRVLDMDKYFTFCMDSLKKGLGIVLMKNVLEHQALTIHHTYPGLSQSSGQYTSRYSWLGDQPTHYISRSSIRHAFQSNS
jgi:hypothetical protein